MSYFIQINGDYSEQIASNKGYGDFGEWVDSLPAGDHPCLSHLWENGWCQKPNDLLDELASALTESPPDEKSVGATAHGILNAINDYGDGMKVVTVTDGFADDEVGNEKSLAIPQNLLAEGYTPEEVKAMRREVACAGEL